VGYAIAACIDNNFNTSQVIFWRSHPCPAAKTGLSGLSPTSRGLTGGQTGLSWEKVKPVPGCAAAPDLPDGVQPEQIIRRPGSGVVGHHFGAAVNFLSL